MRYVGNQRAEQIAALITTEIERAFELPLNIPLPRDGRLQNLCQMLLRDPSLPLTLEQFADQSAASSKTLARLCRNELGMTFTNWRRRVRFAKALELLGQHQPMKRVAQACGYDSPSAFTFAFRKEFGVAPTDFRKGSSGRDARCS